ncbi:MAG: HEPN domain-containing protein [Anaerolineae bacterium]
MVDEIRLAPITINDVTVKPKSKLHHRKLEALRVFMDRLGQSPAWERVAKAYLFGSVLDGDVEEESDVDLLIFGTEAVAGLQEACSDLSFDTMLETGEKVEALVYPLSDFYEPDSYFVFQTLREAREVYSMSEKALVSKAMENYYLLAKEYLESAKESRKGERLRLAIDGAYNAAELCAKAFLLGKVEKMPSKHGSVIRLFSDLYIKTDVFPLRVGRQLNRTFDWRNKARYEYEVEITAQMVEDTISLAQEMLGLLKDHMAQEQADETGEK